MLGSVSDDDDGDDDGEQGPSLISAIGPASCTMLGTELGPDERLSSKICHCLLLSVYCLLSLLNSLPKNMFYI